MTRPAPIAAAVLMLAGLAACGDTGLPAPTETGVCWHMVQTKDGKYRFNELAKAQPNLENCAARLEDMRQRFNSLGKQEDSVVGAYQGQYIFIDPRGVFTAQNLGSTRYLALVKTHDGRLAIPGAIRQQ